jgi:hypothetical protein
MSARLVKNQNFGFFNIDHTIKPILLYGCEIWGYFNPFTSRFRNGNIPIDQIEPELLNHIPKYL